MFAHVDRATVMNCPELGKRKRTTTTKRNANKETATHENTPFVFSCPLIRLIEIGMFV